MSVLCVQCSESCTLQEEMLIRVCNTLDISSCEHLREGKKLYGKFQMD